MVPFGRLQFKMPDVEKRAFEELKKCYGNDIEVPVAIELVAELSGYIHEIRSIPGLVENFDVAAALCPEPGKKLTIFVDQNEFDNCSVRSRFSVAHELGHAVMHSDIYNKANKFTADEAVKIQNEIEKSYNDLEKQANYFAGAILMPYNYFTGVVVKLYSLHAKEYDYDFNYLKQIISARLAPVFEVSSYATGYRLADMGLEGYIRRAAKNQFDDLQLQFFD